jgi:hypothetical protein
MIMTPQLKRAVRLAFRKTRDRGLGDPLHYKALVARRLAECSENGTIAVVTDGRDCDGCSYRRVSHMPTPTLVEWLRWNDQRQEWLDGPELCWLAKPSEEPEGYDERQSQWGN